MSKKMCSSQRCVNKNAFDSLERSEYQYLQGADCVVSSMLKWKYEQNRFSSCVTHRLTFLKGNNNQLKILL